MPPLKLHLKTGGASAQPSTPAADTPAPRTGGGSGGGGFKLKLSSQPVTPAGETVPPSADKKKRAYQRKDIGKKRPADDDAPTSAAKRVASDAPESRRSSLLVLKGPKSAAAATTTPLSAAPASAGPKLKLNKRQSAAPLLTRLNVKGRVPDRIPGNGYDSEDSERERDPATEQQLILRMQPGEDCDYLREAIAERRIGVPTKEGGADVTLKFIERDLRRAVINIRGRMYAAALVDMPCIVETMKSWDKKGWWKVTDIHQMLLVLGRCASDEEAKHYPLPTRVVNPTNMQYAHGLTPPMHYVRKRRFRKRLSYKDTANVEEEVQKLLEDDDRAEADGGDVTMEIHNRDSLERSVEPPESYLDDDADADGDAVSTIEDAYPHLNQEHLEEMDVDDAAAQITALFGQDAGAEVVEQQPSMTSDPLVDSPAPLADVAASFAQTHAGLSDSAAETPTAATSTPAAEQTSDEDESDEDDDDDEDGIDVVDEDAAQRAAERAQQVEEVKDLEREVEIQRQKLAGQKNQLLREKTARQLRSLEEDLRVKRRGLGIEDDEEE